MSATVAMDGKCGAMSRNGRPCRKPAGAGTSHVGAGRCSHHGGCTPTGDAHGARILALREMAAMGGEVDVNPLDALLYTVRRGSGLASFYRLHAEIRTIAGEDPEPYASLEMQALGYVNQWSDRAIKAGVAERMVRIAENTGERLASALEDALEGVELSGQQRGQIVARFAASLSRLEREQPAIEAKAT